MDALTPREERWIHRLLGLLPVAVLLWLASLIKVIWGLY